MATEFFSPAIVLVSLLVLVVAPFLPMAAVICRNQPWPTVSYTAMVLGCSIQATMGMLWGHLGRGGQKLELILFFAIAIAGLAVFLASAQKSLVLRKKRRERGYLGLYAILAAGAIIRIIHPIEMAYLGQSDAYTHLHYIHNIVASGLLDNPVYPPGFHWVMAMPSLIFGLDPYLVARYGGVFSGLGLILGIYVFLLYCFNERAALMGSFCAAAFPGMMLLIKTGVGVFANQFGLMLLPAIFMSYRLMVAREEGPIGAGCLLLFSLCGLVAAVPMMLFHVLLIIAIERVFSFLKERRGFLRRSLLFLLLFLPAVTLFGYHFIQVGAGNRVKTVTIMTDHGTSIAAPVESLVDSMEKKLVVEDKKEHRLTHLIVTSPYLTLISDYVSIKRIGFGNRLLNAAAVILGILFGLCMVVGIGLANPSFLLLGLWGGITVLQTSTGLLQFSAYQREGWSLLVAISCLAGVMAAPIYKICRLQGLFHKGAILVLALLAGWTIMHPPKHPAIHSPAEDSIIRSVRYVSNYWKDGLDSCEKDGIDFCLVFAQLDKKLPLSLVTRSFTGWSNQGELVANVLQPGTSLGLQIVGPKDTLQLIKGQQYLVLIDAKQDNNDRPVGGIFAMMSPSLVKQTMRSLQELSLVNAKIEAKIRDLSKAKWKVSHVFLTKELTAYIITPQ